MQDTAKKAFYAAVGAPVVTARWVGTRFGEVAERVSAETRKEYDIWAEEGEKIFSKLGEQPVVEDLASRVDIDQLQGQMHKIREQLEDMLEAWRDSFLPEKESIEVKDEAKEAKPEPAKAGAKKAETDQPAPKTEAKKAPAAKAKAEKAPAAKTEAKKTEAKKSPPKKAPATKSPPKAEDK